MDSYCEILKEKLYNLNMAKTIKALSMAEFAHYKQSRADKITPFIEHPCFVALYLLEKNIKDEDILSIAILHDVIEDTNIEEYELRYIFGDKIVDDILKLSKEKGADVIPYFREIDKYDHLVMIKAADRIHNLVNMEGCFSEEKQEKYRNESLYILKMLEKRKNINNIFKAEFEELEKLIYV